MTTSDEAFLDEVENFLGSCTLPAILAPHDSGSDSKEVLPTSTSTTPSERVADIVSLRPSLTFKVKIKVDAATKRELEKAKDRKRRSAYRERRRIERESLQKELEQLTETLQRAQDGEPNLYASVWRKLAERQYAARLSAETERRQLCRSIDVHGTLLHQFRAMIDERFAGDVSAVPYEHKRVRLEPSGDPIFAAYLDELAGVYAQTEEILRSGDLDSTEANWEEPSEAWIKDPDTGYFLYRGKLTLPFNYRDICRSRWFTAPLHHRNECRQVYEDVDDPENTIALKERAHGDRLAAVHRG
ncbi:hypothetical protein PRIC1_010223 [Phytophthora ramorum]